ncbi:MAG: hypothetical protein Q9202_006177 [Teloschistes flavicans]
MLTRSIYVLSLAASVLAHEEHHDQTPIEGPHQGLWYKTYENRIPGDGGTQSTGTDSATRGAPFDTATSYRPGARFGPQGIRQGSRRLNLYYDNAYAIQQIEQGHNLLLTRPPFTDAHKPGPSKLGKTLPRIITLGGDHTITLPLLRSVVAAYGPVSVIHFDSHLDTWRPKVFGGAPTLQASINHGTYFYHAHAEGLLANDTNIHAGIRTTLSGLSDYDNDGYCGFQIVEAREIDTIGTAGIIKKIRDRVGTERPVYLSIDIDTLDPAFAPATGTPETGGWSTRELREIIRGLSYPSPSPPSSPNTHSPSPHSPSPNPNTHSSPNDQSGPDTTGTLHKTADPINIVAADIVEVAPAYDTNAELTTMAAADTLFEVMGLMVLRGPLSVKGERGE